MKLNLMALPQPLPFEKKGEGRKKRVAALTLTKDLIAKSKEKTSDDCIVAGYQKVCREFRNTFENNMRKLFEHQIRCNAY